MLAAIIIIIQNRNLATSIQTTVGIGLYGLQRDQAHWLIQWLQ